MRRGAWLYAALATIACKGTVLGPAPPAPAGAADLSGQATGRQRDGGPNMLAFVRSSGSNRILVVLNADTRPTGLLAIRLARTVDGAGWSDGTRLDEILRPGAPAGLAVSGGEVVVSLPPLTSGVYRARRP